MPSSRRRAAAAVAALLTGLVLIASTSRHEAHALPANRPNILVIIADDQHPSTFTPTYMPAVFSQLVGKGVRFDRGYVNSSRALPVAVGVPDRLVRAPHAGSTSTAPP